jgi:hypothetical protein
VWSISEKFAVLAGAVALLLPVSTTFSTELDLQANVDGTLAGAYFTRDAAHTSGTSVVSPFLTVQHHGGCSTEQGYNTSGGLVLNTERPAWNRDLRLRDLQTFSIAGNNYYKFILEAIEAKDNGQKLISINNIRIYTSSVGSQTNANPDLLGTLRYAMNNPLKDASGNFIIDNWVKLDAADANGHRGGFGDLAVYIPTTNFAGASANDFVYFYNLNGVNYSMDNAAGAEEWWAATKPTSIPKAGNTLALLGTAIVGVFGVGTLLRRAAK